jgi:enoyl-[acyl-carrier-protein] reductase (NADH)
MGFLADRKILVTGVLSNRSIAYGIARACQREGATLAFTYVSDDLKERVVRLAGDFGTIPVLRCDVAKDEDIDALFASLSSEWGGLDGLLHSIAFAPREALSGDFLNGISRAAFATAHDISSYSFAALAKGARPLMQGRNAAMVTLTYLGAVRALSNYNVMGLAKASLEANVRYLRGHARSGADPGQRHLGRPDQDARRGGHRRFLEDPELRREERPPAAQCDDRRGRQRGRVPALSTRERDHRRDHVRRLRLLQRRRRAR